MSIHRLSRISEESFAAHRGVEDGDKRLADRRRREWADEGYGAGQSDGPRSTDVSRPTEAAAIDTRPDETTIHGHTHTKIEDQVLYWLRLFNQSLSQRLRPTEATNEELKSTEYVSETVRRGRAAGVCNACGKECTGARNNRLNGYDLCSTHYAAVRRGKERGETAEATVESIRSGASSTWRRGPTAA